MSRGKEYEGIHRKSSQQDKWHLQRRREIRQADEDARIAQLNAKKENAIQAKLEISQEGDVHEQQADLIAKKVVNGDDANVNQLSPASTSVQSKSEGGGMQASDQLQAKLESSKGSGQSMDDATKSEMETKMGTDFSDVKIHTGAHASEMSESINAKAFTHGQDVYFKGGNYNPSSDEGKELLAHELTHTVQQGEGMRRKIMKAPDERPHPAKPQVAGSVNAPENIQGQPAADLVLENIFNVSPIDVSKTNLGWSSNKDQKYQKGHSIKATMDFNQYLHASDKLNREANAPDYSELETYFSNWTDNSVKWEEAHQVEEIPRSLYYRVAQYPHPYIAKLRTSYNRNGKTFDQEVHSYKEQYLKAQGIPYTVEEAEAKDLFEVFEGGFNSRYVNYFKDLELLINVAEASVGMGQDTQFVKEAVAPENTLALPTLVLQTLGSSTVTVDSTTAFTLLDNGAFSGPLSQVTWYALYDTRPESPPPDAFPVVTYPKESTDKNKLTQEFLWKAAGLQLVVCEVKTTTDSGIVTKRFATQVFVYPNAKIFADQQADKDLLDQKNASIPGDLLMLDSLVYKERMKYKDNPKLSKYLAAYSDAVGEAIIEEQLVTNRKMQKLKQANPNTVTSFELEQQKFARLLESYKTDDDQNLQQGQTSVPGPQETKGEKLKAFFNVLSEYLNANTSTRSDFSSRVYEGGDVTTYTGASNAEAVAGVGNGKSLLANPLPPFSEATYDVHANIINDYRTATSLLDGIILEELSDKVVEKKQFENITSFHHRVQDVYGNHPDAITIPTMFYPDVQQLTRKDKTAPGGIHESKDFLASGYRVNLYLYKENGKWVLDDATPESQARNKIDVLAGETAMPSEGRFDSLFSQMNYKDRFPKGTIYYTVPGGSKDGKDYTNFVLTTADMTLSDWLTTIGIVFAIISLPFTFGGSTVALTVFGISAGIAIATMAADMYDMYTQERWNAQVIALDLLSVIGDLAAVAAAAGKIGRVVAASSKLMKLAGESYIAIKSVELIANTTSMVVMEYSILSQLSELDAIEDPDQRRFAKIRLMTTALLIGAAHIISVRNDLDELTKAMRAGKTIDLFANIANETIASIRLSDEELKAQIMAIGGKKQANRFDELLKRKDIDKAHLESSMGVYLDRFKPIEKDLDATLKKLEKAGADTFTSELENMENAAVTADVVENIPLVSGVRDAEADQLLGDAVAEMKRNRIETLVGIAVGVTLIGVGALEEEDNGNTQTASMANATTLGIAIISGTLYRGIRARRIPLTGGIDEVIQFLQNLRTFKRLDLTNIKVKELIGKAWDDAKMIGFTKAEVKEVNRYRSLNPHSTLANGEIVTRLRKGEQINAEGYFFDPDISSVPDVKLDMAKVVKKPSLAVTELDAADKLELDTLKKQRDEWIVERDRYKPGAPEENEFKYKENDYRVKVISEQLGEKSADIYMTRLGGKKIYPPKGMESPGAGDLDQVWEMPDGSYTVVEAKGGSGTYGSRKVKNMKGQDVQGKRVQQGTLPYLQDVIGEMKKRGGESLTTANKLNDAIDATKSNPKNIKISYIGIRQDFDANGILKPIEITDFKIF